jgi:hypothetical protein
MKSKIILIEGLWNTGKSYLSSCICSAHDGELIKEPDHLKHNIQSDIEEWYLNAFIDQNKRAFELKEKNKKIIIERSPLSLLSYCFSADLKEKYNKFRSTLESNDLFYDFIITIRSHSNNHAVLTNPDHPKFKKTPILANNPSFIINYENFIFNNINLLKYRKIIEIKQTSELILHSDDIKKVLELINE